ncbi:MAG: filamentous hemagglutinin family protein, partial [Lentimonas sp.]
MLQFIIAQNVFLMMGTVSDAKALTANGNFEDIDGIVRDGTTNTMTDRTAGGNAMVYTATTSAGGVSDNHMTDYQNYENTILNNRKGEGVYSHLEGGFVNRNPNYGRGINEAKIILIQVTGPNRTNMRAITEIVGGTAALIIANSNGIDIAGASFMNTDKLTFVGGRTTLDENGNLNKFDMSRQLGSSITIAGVNNNGVISLGLDASNVQYVDIVSRSIEVVGEIQGNEDEDGELNLRMGNDKFDYGTKEITSDDSLGAATKPAFALDSSHIGGMYAGRINLIATENGLGVRTRGTLVSNVSDINFDVAGDIEYEAIKSEGDINITSRKGDITQGRYQDAGHISAAAATGDINIEAQDGSIKLSGQNSEFYLLDAQNLNISASEDLTIENGKAIARSGDIILTADQKLTLIDQELDSTLGNIVLTSNLGNIDIQSNLSASIISAALN